MAMKGNLFFATTATAGTIVPVQASGITATFALLNPPTSKKYIELVAYIYGMLNATTVVSDVSLYFQRSPAALGTPATLTVRSGVLGKEDEPSVCTAYSSGVITGAIVKGPTLLSFGAVTANNALPMEHQFRGRIIVPPNTLITTAGNAAQTQAAQQTLFWREHRVG